MRTLILRNYLTKPVCFILITNVFLVFAKSSHGQESPAYFLKKIKAKYVETNTYDFILKYNFFENDIEQEDQDYSAYFYNSPQLTCLATKTTIILRDNVKLFHIDHDKKQASIYQPFRKERLISQMNMDSILKVFSTSGDIRFNKVSSHEAILKMHSSRQKNIYFTLNFNPESYLVNTVEVQHVSPETTTTILITYKNQHFGSDAVCKYPIKNFFIINGNKIKLQPQYDHYHFFNAFENTAGHE